VIELPVADPWFVREEMGHGVTLITERHVHPLLRCNVWHVRGRDADLVVDASLGLAPFRDLIARGQSDGPLVVATHSHSDHIGGLGEFSDRAIHHLEVDELNKPVQISLEAVRFGERVIGPYRRAGYEIPALFVDAVPPRGIEAPSFVRDAAPATRALHDGELIDLGDRSLEILHLPGHSPGSIGLWEKATGILFSGDAVYDGPLLDELDGSDIDAYVATMRRLRELPVMVVHGGHEASFDRDRLHEICDSYLTLRARGS
jgi:glyoxylase-like metal-dependent hydrolase (beta-lactamase superfamily II)